MLCAYTRQIYQVSVYRTIGPLVMVVLILCHLCLPLIPQFLSVSLYNYGGSGTKFT